MSIFRKERYMADNTLDKINRFSRKKLTENELYTFSVILCDNEVDRDGERFSDEALVKMKELFIGKTGICDHKPSAENQHARIYDTELVTTDKLTADGRVYKYLKAHAYMVRTENNTSLIAEIDGGIKKEVSVSCNAVKRICSVCGADRNIAGCEHSKGKDYGGGKCHYILDDITDAYEWSFVAVPAQINAGVTKKYNSEKEEKSMEFTPITTQAELDAIVGKAVEETKKQYEGWLSPEDAAGLAKERDDAAAQSKAYELNILKLKTAGEKGIPLALAERLVGDTADAISKDADTLAGYLAPKVQPSPKFSGDTPVNNSETAAQLAMLAAINKN